MNRDHHQMGALRDAFDRHAGTYDHLFSNSPMASEMRRRTWEVMDEMFRPGQHVLDLGCGTGEDALHLAERGVRVHAIDLSKSMVDRVIEKARNADVDNRIECEVADCSRLQPGDGPFDGMISNFGTLNCIPDLTWLGQLTERSLAPGAAIILVLMGRLYPFEIMVNISRGRWGTAVRRFGADCEAVVAGVRFEVRYHPLGTLVDALATHADLERSQSLNLILPVPGLEHWNARFPRFFKALRPVDAWLSHRRPLSTSGDHFLTVWRRREAA